MVLEIMGVSDLEMIVLKRVERMSETYFFFFSLFCALSIEFHVSLVTGSNESQVSRNKPSS